MCFHGGLSSPSHGCEDGHHHMRGGEHQARRLRVDDEGVGEGVDLNDGGGGGGGYEGGVWVLGGGSVSVGRG